MEEKDIEQKAIRTYESDIADAIQHRGTSQVSITLAEEKKRREDGVVVLNTENTPKTPRSWGKNILKIVISILLLAAGVAIAYYLYTISPLSIKQPSTPATNSPTLVISSIITPDLQKIIDVTGKTNGGIINQIQNTYQPSLLPNGGILELVIAAQASTTENGQTTSVLTKMTGVQFISALGLVPPNALTSSLTNQWMLGIYSATAETEASGSAPASFVILTTNFFQNAFAGMLKWEPTMGSDLSGLFGLQASQWSAGQFHDKVIKNKDAREFTDAEGNPLFLYSFVNNNTLVIAQSETALGEIITRFESQAYVR
jgi:hypothetical protein